MQAAISQAQLNGPGLFMQQSFPFCSLLRRLVLLIIILKDSQSKNQVY